jgi:hypothetical protein
MTKLLIGILFGVCRYQNIRPASDGGKRTDAATVPRLRCLGRQHPDGCAPAGSLFVFGDQSGHRVALRAHRLFHQVAAFLAIEVWRRLTALDHHRSKLTAVAALSDKFRRELDDRLAGLCYCTLTCCSEFGFTEWWTTFFHWVTNATRDRMMMTPLRPCKDERYQPPCLLFRRPP